MSMKIQNSNQTSLNRYPSIFLEVKKYVDEHCQGRGDILSVGCSTGEEIISLDHQYLKNCNLIGADVDAACIAAAKGKKGSGLNKIDFTLAERVEGSFDVVIALSVFCRWPETQSMKNISEVFSFEAFNAACSRIEKLVKVGGCLFIHNSNFYFEDSTAFRKFRIYNSFDNIGFVERFDIDSKRYVNRRRGYVIFQKCE